MENLTLARVQEHLVLFNPGVEAVEGGLKGTLLVEGSRLCEIHVVHVLPPVVNVPQCVVKLTRGR